MRDGIAEKMVVDDEHMVVMIAMEKIGVCAFDKSL